MLKVLLILALSTTVLGGELQCAEDEVIVPCANARCGFKSCSEIGQPQVCADLIASSCVKGCSCPSGTLKARNGKCVPFEECGAEDCGDNTEFTTCIQTVNRTQFCFDSTPQRVYPGEECQPGCACKPGFLRKQLYTDCVPADQC